MDNKMTDKEIKKALECCKDGGNRCDECPYGIDDCLTDNDESILLKDALDLINRKDIKIAELTEEINRQQVEIENLNIELQAMRNAANQYQIENERLLQKLQQPQSEAVKEFAERVKDLFSPEDEVREEINNLVQEMVGDNVYEMTCKDCLSEPSCSLMLKQIYQNKPEECPYFKNKAIPVGVVQCKNCEFVHFNVESCTYHCKRRGYFSEEVESTDFCSNGKEKTTR